MPIKRKTSNTIASADYSKNMEIIRFDYKNLPPKKEGLTLALGTFDGFHKGHQRILIETSLHARNEAGILLFSCSPSKVLRLGKTEEVLTSLEDQLSYAKKLRMDVAYIVEATREFFSLSKDGFMDLLESLGATSLVAGADYTFGNAGEGSVEDLKKRFKTFVVPLVKQNGKKISTRDIKAMLKNGDAKEAWENLGHPYEVKGKVVHGLQNGRKLGFPTLNIELSADYLIPKYGVYYGICYLSGVPHKAMVNVGDNPTIGVLKKANIEAYLLDYEGDAYGKSVYLSFLDYEREERKFASPQQLKSQLEIDKEWIRKHQ